MYVLFAPMRIKLIATCTVASVDLFLCALIDLPLHVWRQYEHRPHLHEWWRNHPLLLTTEAGRSFVPPLEHALPCPTRPWQLWLSFPRSPSALTRGTPPPLQLVHPRHAHSPEPRAPLLQIPVFKHFPTVFKKSYPHSSPQTQTTQSTLPASPSRIPLPNSAASKNTPPTSPSLKIPRFSPPRSSPYTTPPSSPPIQFAPDGPSPWL